MDVASLPEPFHAGDEGVKQRALRLRGRSATRYMAPRRDTAGHRTKAPANQCWPMSDGKTALLLISGIVPMRVFAIAIATGLAVGPFAAAQTPHDPEPPRGPGLTRGLATTEASARRRLPNTVADVSVSIEVHGRTVAAVQRDLGDTSRTLLSFLGQSGADRLRTDVVSVEPQTETDRGHGLRDRIVGYDGTLTVSFRAIADKLNELLSGSVQHGANEIGHINLTPREEEIEAAHEELAAEATRVALARIRVVANAASRSVGDVVRIVVDPNATDSPETSDLAAPSVALPKMAARPSPPMAVAAGDTEMSVTVLVTVELSR